MEPQLATETVRRRRRRWWRWPAWILGGLAALLVVLYLGRARLVAPFVLDYAAAAAGEALGGQLSIDELGGNWFSGLEIRGVRTLRDFTATPLRSVELDELVAEYSLWELLRGEPGWLHSVRADGLRVALDLRQGSAAGDEPEAEPAAAFEAPPWLPKVELTGLSLVLDDQDLHLVVPAASLRAALQAPGRHRLTVEAEVEELVALDQRLDQARLRLEADWLAGRLELPHLVASLDHGDGKLRVTGSLDPSTLAAVVVGESLQLAPYAASAGLDLALLLGLNVELRLPLADLAAAEASVTLSGTEFRGFGFDLHRIESSFQVSDRQLSGGSIELVAPEGLLRLTGLKMPLDPSLPAAELARRSEADLELRLPRLPALLARQGVALEGLPSVTDELVLVGGMHGQELRFSEAGLSGPDGGLSLHGLRLQLGGEQELLSADAIRLPLEFRLARPWTAPDGLELPPLDGKATIAILTPVQTDGVPESARFALERLELNAEDQSVRLSQEARVELNLKRDLRVENFILETPAGKLSLDTRLPLAIGAEELLGEGPLMARGSLLGFDLERFRPLLGELELPVIRGRADLSWELSGTWEQPVLLLAVDGQDWLLARLPTSVPTGPFLFGFELSYADGRAELRRGRLEGGGLDATWSGDLALPLDLRSLAAGGQPALDGPFHADATLVSGELGWLAELAPELRPTVSSGRVSLKAEGTWAAPVVDLDVRVEDLALGAEPGPPIRLTLRARQAGDLLEVQELRAEAEGATLSAAGRLPLSLDPARLLAPGPVDFRVDLGRMQLAAAAALAAPFGALPTIEGSVSAGLSLSGAWDRLRVDGEVHGFGLRTELPTGEVPLETADLDAVFSWADGAAVLEKLEVRSELAQVDAQASLALATSLQDLLDGLPIVPGPLTGAAEVRVPDLSWITGLPNIQRAEGGAQASISLEGPLDQLDFRGEVQLTDATLRLATPGLAAFTALELRGRFDKELITIDSLAGELGAEPFEATGSVRYAGVEEPVLDLAFRGKDLLLYRAQGVKLRANADLRITGPLSQAVAQGKVKVTDGKLVKKIDFLRIPIGAPAPPRPGGLQLFSLAPPLDQLRFDVEVTSKDGFLLRNNVARGRLRPELKLTGTGEVPVVLGEVYLDSMVMDLPATRLVLQPSVVRFLPNDPFRPRLSLRGGMRRYGYDVEMLVTGPYDQPEVLFSSVPPLTQEELILFVSTGQPPAERVDAGGAMSSVAIYLARDFLATFFGDESTEAEESVLDRLEVYTGRDTTRQGEDTIEGRFRLFNQFLFDDDSLYLESEKDSYGDFNIGIKLLIRYP